MCIRDRSAECCSDHFNLSDNEQDLQAGLLNIPSTKRLKKTAIPQLNLPFSSEKGAKILLKKIDHKNIFQNT